MSLLNGIGNTISNAVGGVADIATSAFDRVVANNKQQQRSFEQDGFIVPPIASGSGDGLPSSHASFSRQSHRNTRHIIHWFVPEVGVINMYVNPQHINYKFGKLINSERTKGGYVLQYWGENLPVLSISGNTGSSGIEGINVLQEIYRAEQINFDPIALTMASDSMVSGLGDLVGGVGQAIGGLGGDLFSAATNGALGLNPLTRSILPRNPPTLAALAFSVEMFYAGKVYRGFFSSFSFDEDAGEVGFFKYQMEFTVTQTRGQRINTMPWQRPATQGPSNNSVGGTPFSYGSRVSDVLNSKER